MSLHCLSNEDLADAWYAVAGAEIRHPGCFTSLLERSNAELARRLGDRFAPFVEERFRAIRPIDAVEDRDANARAASDTACD